MQKPWSYHDIRTIFVYKSNPVICQHKQTMWYPLKFFKKFQIIYTGRIYKIFFFLPFIKMLFNRAHKTIFWIDYKGLFWRQYSFEKLLKIMHAQHYAKITHFWKIFQNIRPYNAYTWRSIRYTNAPYLERIGKISEYR